MTGEVCPIPQNCEAFTLGEQVGTGSFANIYKALDKRTGKNIALKSYRLKKRYAECYARAAIEIAFIRYFDHPNIIRFVFADMTSEYVYLALEYSVYGSLANFMETKTGLVESTVQSVMRQLISALFYLHSMFISHGDVKPENVLVIDIKESLMVKLCDFGLSDVIAKSLVHHKRCGSFFYMAPEMHLGFPYDHTCDLYSAGVLMYEMLYGCKPLPTHVTKQQYLTLLKKRHEIKFTIFQYPEFDCVLLTTHCIGLVKNLLSYDKQIRLTGESLLNHPFLKVTPIADNHCHYIKACESLIKSVEKIDNGRYGAGYIDINEAILHLRMRIHKIENDEELLLYMKKKTWEYQKFLGRIEDKLVSGKESQLAMKSLPERLRCLLQSTPALANAYDICVVGEMYYDQKDWQRGSKIMREGLDKLFPLLLMEPEGPRKFMLAAKIDEMMKKVETYRRDQRESCASRVEES